MPVLSSTFGHSINLSLTNLRTLLNEKRDELDRAPIQTEEKYHSKVLIGNWFERRAPYYDIPSTKKWTTIYGQDYRPYHADAYRGDQIAFWDNKIKNEEHSSDGATNKVCVCYRRQGTGATV